MIISGEGQSVRSICAAARRLAGLKLRDSREVLRSGGEDGLYRIHLADETVVECTVKPHGVVSVELQSS